MMILLVVTLCLLCLGHGFVSHSGLQRIAALGAGSEGHLKRRSALSASGDSEVNKVNPIWRDRVEFVDLSIVNVESSSTQRTLPLFVLGSPFYPQGRSSLNIFEMRYRTMMFDCAKADDMFGYIYSDPQTGQIASIGTMCKIVDRQLLEDGRQYISFEGVSRFRVRKIVKTLPYMLADVEPNIVDDIPEDIHEAKELEMCVYNNLKYYIRLMRAYPRMGHMSISANCRDTRPRDTRPLMDSPAESPAESPTLDAADAEDAARRSGFSFALANMIQLSEPVDAQLLLQTTSVMKRLESERQILQTAVDNVVSQLLKMGLMTEASRTLIEDQSFNSAEDSDCLPHDKEEEEEEEDEEDEWNLQNAL